ncbi:MAG: site-2 protease family protein [Acidimicrobiia bacterium]|nr:site-2 protease family protein [Acidimicrobiia bacterium]
MATPPELPEAPLSSPQPPYSGPHGPGGYPYPRLPLQEPERRTKYALLLLATFLTTTVVGGLHYAAWVQDFRSGPLPLSSAELYLNGLWYSLSILGILGCHEMGHYLACRYYSVDASLPYFLPAPLPLTGTLGAFIRIRQPIPTKRQLFDIGIAGPIAGFVVAVPLLVIGVAMSRVVMVPPDFQGMELGEPLLFRLVSWLTWGTPPEGYSINMHPMAFAAWFGLLATALNLFPIGQLDGGHISYAVFGRRSTLVTFGTVACLIGLTFVSTSWMVWTVLTIAMLVAFGPRHPRTVDEDVPLDRGRRWLAAFALVMFGLCFTPAPIEPLDLVSPQQPQRRQERMAHACPPAQSTLCGSTSTVTLRLMSGL